MTPVKPPSDDRNGDTSGGAGEGHRLPPCGCDGLLRRSDHSRRGLKVKKRRQKDSSQFVPMIYESCRPGEFRKLAHHIRIRPIDLCSPAPRHTGSWRECNCGRCDIRTRAARTHRRVSSQLQKFKKKSATLKLWCASVCYCCVTDFFFYPDFSMFHYTQLCLSRYVFNTVNQHCVWTHTP